LILEGLGLSNSDKEMLLNNVQVIINSAASVSFDDPLLESLNINYFGNLRMFELAKSCKNI
jgi:fatty acyl-CoA reductase